ncbi:ANTAR domain-containing protein [Rhodoferax sp.]|uniref:ANTAR domain-containing protein n=1 Tax=Rhodoferax sp. TaxID=50421 RepID=UPI0025D85295|nr:ANTAR domain-containing protein [Rhodoferax sp.]
MQAAHLQAASLDLLGEVTERNKLVHGVVRHAPDVLVCELARPDAAFFKLIQTLADTAPCAVLLFTMDADAEHIQSGVASGVHAYIVDGYAPQRLRALVQLAQARFQHEHGLRQALQDATTRFEERKVVDRAKGILMRARHLSDDDAFRILRTASMHTNQRLGQVSQSIVYSALYADGVNRAGQLRMLSQRLVKLYLLQLAGCPQRTLLQESIQRVDANLALLGKSLSQATFGDLVERAGQTWARLQQALQAPPKAATTQATQATQAIDALAEQLLQEAERLTAALESSGGAPPLHILNTAGRQRMLCQRFAKCALLGPTVAAAMVEAQLAFEQAQTYLQQVPLGTPEIRRLLEAAALGWQQLQAGSAELQRPAGLERLAQASEDLLDVYEQLSNQFETSMQMLMG